MGSRRTNGGTRTPSERFLRPVCIPFHHVSLRVGVRGENPCLLVDSNHRHRDFQSLALPPELKRPSTDAPRRAARRRPPPRGRGDAPPPGRKGMEDSNPQSTPPKGAALPIWPMPSRPHPPLPAHPPGPGPGPSPGPGPWPGPRRPILHDPLGGPLPPSSDGTLSSKYLLAGGVEARFGGGYFWSKKSVGGRREIRRRPSGGGVGPRSPVPRSPGTGARARRQPRD